MYPEGGAGGRGEGGRGGVEPVVHIGRVSLRWYPQGDTISAITKEKNDDRRPLRRGVACAKPQCFLFLRRQFLG